MSTKLPLRMIRPLSRTGWLTGLIVAELVLNLNRAVPADDSQVRSLQSPPEISQPISPTIVEPIIGRAMGMMYRLDFGETISAEAAAKLSSMIADELERIEKIFSLYRNDSELSRWNANRSTEPIEVGEDLAALVKQSEKLWSATKGGFDPTIRPLMAVWDWDSFDADWKPPQPNELKSVLRLIGFDKIEIDSNGRTLRKTVPTVELDLNALVEGWSIDRIVKIAESRRLNNFLFQLGGEFYGAGRNSEGEAWTIGIEDPGNPSRLVGRIRLHDQALSVSGNYRSGRECGGRWYSQILDPRTGLPSRTSPSLVAVVSTSAFEADGWATAFMTLDQTEAGETASSRTIASCLVEATGLGHTVRLYSFDESTIRFFPEVLPNSRHRGVILSTLAAALFVVSCVWIAVRRYNHAR